MVREGHPRTIARLAFHIAREERSLNSMTEEEIEKARAWGRFPVEFEDDKTSGPGKGLEKYQDDATGLDQRSDAEDAMLGLPLVRHRLKDVPAQDDGVGVWAQAMRGSWEREGITVRGLLDAVVILYEMSVGGVDRRLTASDLRRIREVLIERAGVKGLDVEGSLDGQVTITLDQFVLFWHWMGPTLITIRSIIAMWIKCEPPRSPDHPDVTSLEYRLKHNDEPPQVQHAILQQLGLLRTPAPLVYGFLSHEAAVARLIHYPAGTFLLRFSDNNPGRLTFCLRLDSRTEPIRRIQVQVSGDYFVSHREGYGTVKYPSLADLILDNRVFHQFYPGIPVERLRAMTAGAGKPAVGKSGKPSLDLPVDYRSNARLYGRFADISLDEGGGGGGGQPSFGGGAGAGAGAGAGMVAITAGMPVPGIHGPMAPGAGMPPHTIVSSRAAAARQYSTVSPDGFRRNGPGMAIVVPPKGKHRAIPSADQMPGLGKGFDVDDVTTPTAGLLTPTAASVGAFHPTSHAVLAAPAFAHTAAAGTAAAPPSLHLTSFSLPTSSTSFAPASVYMPAATAVASTALAQQPLIPQPGGVRVGGNYQGIPAFSIPVTASFQPASAAAGVGTAASPYTSVDPRVQAYSAVYRSDSSGRSPEHATSQPTATLYHGLPGPGPVPASLLSPQSVGGVASTPGFLRTDAATLPSAVALRQHSLQQSTVAMSTLGRAVATPNTSSDPLASTTYLPIPTTGPLDASLPASSLYHAVTDFQPPRTAASLPPPAASTATASAAECSAAPLPSFTYEEMQLHIQQQQQQLQLQQQQLQQQQALLQQQRQPDADAVSQLPPFASSLAESNDSVGISSNDDLPM